MEKSRLPLQVRPAVAPKTVEPVQRALQVTASQIRRKLVVGSTTDPLEAEADHVAAIVAARIGAAPATAAPESEAEQADENEPVAASPIGRLSRSAGAPKTGGDGFDVGPEVSSRINRARGGGAALDERVRTPMEREFGADFSGVRVHHGGESDTLNRAVGAKAFTIGSDVFFGKGQYRPGSASGNQLIAHELTHAVQNDGGLRRTHDETIRRAPGDEEAVRTLTLDIAVVKTDLDVCLSLIEAASAMVAGLIPMVAMSIANPGLAGAVTSMADAAKVPLVQASTKCDLVSHGWTDISAKLSTTNIAALVTLFDNQLQKLQTGLFTWQGMLGAVGPGTMDLVGMLMSDMAATKGVTAGLAGGMLNPANAKLTAAQPPLGGAPPPPAPPAPAPGAPAGAGAVAAPIVAAPAGAEAAPAGPIAAGPAAAPPAPAMAAPPPRVLKNYKYLKSRGDHYNAEDTAGSPDLPLILQAGEQAVAANRVASIDVYMMKHFGWSQGDVDKYVHAGDKATVKYMQGDEKDAHELHGGSSITQGVSKDPFDTGAMFSKHSGKGFGIYVMAKDGAMYADQHKIGLFHHSTFLSGGDVAGAGEIKVEGGTVKWVTNKTGHYRAGEEELWQVLDELKGRGVSLGGVQISVGVSKDAIAGGAAAFHANKKPARA